MAARNGGRSKQGERARRRPGGHHAGVGAGAGLLAAAGLLVVGVLAAGCRQEPSERKTNPVASDSSPFPGAPVPPGETQPSASSSGPELEPSPAPSSARDRPSGRDGSSSHDAPTAHGPASSASAQGKLPKAGGSGGECAHDADCTVLQADCCNCMSGGRQRAIARADVEAARKEIQGRCAHTMCPMNVSHDPTCAQVPVCQAGLCSLGPAAR